MASVVAGFMLCAPLPTMAQSAPPPVDRAAALEARLDALEAELASLRAELAEARRSTAQPAPADAPATTAPATAPVPTVDQRLTALEGQTAAPGFRVGSTRFSIGGYLKLDGIASDFSGGDPLANALINDYYSPGQIPVGGTSEGVDLTTSVRETRLILRSETPLDGKMLAGLLEVDFLDTPQLGNQRVSNSFVPRVRRAYISWNNLTFGQDWSTFQNSAALPERIDFIGPTEGSVFERQPLVRWRSGNLSIAVENPETTVSVGTTSLEADDDVAPDVVLRYDHRYPHGSFAVAAIGRWLNVDNLTVPTPAGARLIDGSSFGWGISASGVHDFGQSRLSWMATAGEGIGRYMGLNIRDDVMATASGDIDPPFAYSGFVALRHTLSTRWRIIGTAAAFHTETPDYAAQLLTSTVWSGNVDLLYNPVTQLTLGIGFRYANRELADDSSGSLRRLQLSAKFDY